MLEIILEPFLYVIFVGLGYVVGLLPVVVLSLGTIEPGPIMRAGDRIFYRGKGMKWWHLTYKDNGTTVLPAEGVALLGWLFLAAIAFIIWGIVCTTGIASAM